ncbi:6117_t:CDS:2 [Ambispora gerdemannii]|uniref:6117_t:CDS:1 n=1 Tax=Ambispora gerdemannii TaxID=144530 RepID=A0A9N8W4F9_9GLOM|nr:6117_t:CDS:2 [Ambispora gerdemannii]
MASFLFSVSCIAPQSIPILSPIHTPSGFSSPEFTSPPPPPPGYQQLTTSPTSNNYFHYPQDTTTSSYDQQRRQSYTSVTSSNGSLSPNLAYHSQHFHRRHHDNNGINTTTTNTIATNAEKRRRNAGASARFRDRRKQRERDMQEKCQFLERRVQELESLDTAKRISELERRLEEANSEKHNAKSKIRELEDEVSVHDYLTPPSSSGESDAKEYYSPQSRSSRSSSIQGKFHYRVHTIAPPKPKKETNENPNCDFS